MKVNNTEVNSLREKAYPKEVTINGEPIEYPFPLYIAMHKPVGYVCSRKRDLLLGEDIVYDLLPPKFIYRKPYLVPVGRLDKWAQGLLIMTQDGIFSC